MKQLIMVFVAAALLGGNGLAQERRQAATKGDSIATWHGYLVDAKSAQEWVKSQEVAMKNAAEYTTETALKDESRASGYGIITEGKWLKFDKAGDDQVAKFLKATTQVKGIMITATGTLDGNTLTVTSLKEPLQVGPSSPR